MIDKQKTPFVSRGGLKLQAALEEFKLDVSGKIVLDVGSSTGGFVDCLLQNGAVKVYSVDTCYGELAWKLRNDPKVVVMERTNILYLTSLSGSDPKPKRPKLEPDIGSDPGTNIDLVTIDASWTKLELILPVVQKFLKPDGVIIALLKPHYQSSKKDLIKGILPEEKAEQVRLETIENIKNLQFQIKNSLVSPILGGAGNKEFLLYLQPV